MQDLQPTYEIVENCLKRVGINPADARGNKEGQWSLTKGSAQIWIDVWFIERENRAYIQVMAPIMQLPTEKLEKFYRELLETNDRLYQAAFTIYSGHVWLKTIREVDGLDESEAFAMLTRLGNYADQYDDILKDAYGTHPVDAATPSPTRNS